MSFIVLVGDGTRDGLEQRPIVNEVHQEVPLDVDIAGTVAVTGPLTDAQLRATPVPVSGSFSVTGGLTDAELRASPVAVSLTSTTITGSVAVTGPLTDVQLRATPVPVSGPLTDVQLRATPVPVSLTSTTITGSVAVTGPLTDVQLRATPVPVSLASTTLSSPVTVSSITDTVTTQLTRTASDAFGWARVSVPETIFDSHQTFDAEPLHFDTAVTGTGSVTYSNAEARSRLTVTAGAGTAVRQTFRRFVYQPGRSQLVYMTGVLRVAGTFSATVVSRMGLYSTNSGVFFSYDGTAATPSVTVRKGGVDTAVAQASWNLDPMDGTGASGLTLDVTQTQIFVINFQWLGVGSVWYGFHIGGTLHWVHRFDNANTASTVYMTTPALPLRAEILCSAGSGSMDAICCAVISEGGVKPRGAAFAFPTSAFLNANTAGVEYCALLFRYKSESAAQRTISKFVISTTGTTTDDYIVLLRIIRNTALITNFGTQTWTSITNSALEVARPIGNPGDAVVTADSFSGSSGAILSSTFVIGTTTAPLVTLEHFVSPGWSLAGASDILSLSIVPLTANLDVYAALNWLEQ